VQRWGVSGQGVRLAARSVEFPEIGLLWPGRESQVEYEIVDVSDPDQLPVHISDHSPPPTHPHFPFGLEVEPD